MMTLSVVAALACIAKFLADGASFVINGHPVSLGHADSMSYGALLTPILGTHGYLQSLIKPKGDTDNVDQK